MKINSLVCGFLFVSMFGCSGRNSDVVQKPVEPSAAPPPATKQVRITGIQRINFPKGDSALVLNYETDISIEDKQALGEEVSEIWQRFQKEVEKANLNTGVIRATHYEGTGMVRKGNGYGFVFVKGADGNWQRKNDTKN